MEVESSGSTSPESSPVTPGESSSGTSVALSPVVSGESNVSPATESNRAADVVSIPRLAGPYRLMECPKCHSDDVTRSRRKFWERFVLPLLSAHVHRCRDCKHRFWIGTHWSRLVFASIAVFFVVGIFTTVTLIRKAKEAPPPVVQQPLRPRRRRLPPLPPGLPPLSQVPRPKDLPKSDSKLSADPAASKLPPLSLGPESNDDLSPFPAAPQVPKSKDNPIAAPSGTPLK